MDNFTEAVDTFLRFFFFFSFSKSKAIGLRKKHFSEILRILFIYTFFHSFRFMTIGESRNEDYSVD